jgi:hypothetical protein
MQTRGVCFVCSRSISSKDLESPLLHHNPAPRTQQPQLKMSSRLPSYRENDRTRPSRSRSPRRQTTHSRRERSPHRHHHKRKRSPDPASTEPPRELPFNSRQLTKRDYEAFKPMFALYLDIQKGKVLEELDETEIKGRWKSFLGKW